MKLKTKLVFSFCKDFLDIWLSEKRRSQNTITAYSDALTLFHLYALDKGFAIDRFHFSDLSEKFMFGFRNWMLDARHNKPQTVNHRFSLIRNYIEYCGKDDPAVTALWLRLKDIPLLRTEESSEEALSEANMSFLLRQLPDTSKGLRNRTLMILMYETAARISELRFLTIGQLHLEGANPHVEFLGKGNKRRRIPITDNTHQHIKEYLKHFHQKGGNALDCLFYTVAKGKKGPLSHDCISAFLNKYADMAREINPLFPDRIHSHLFRSSKATHLNDNGISLPVISRYLGHAEVTTTMIYIKPNQEKMREAIEMAASGHEFSPEDKSNYEKLRARMCGIR